MRNYSKSLAAAAAACGLALSPVAETWTIPSRAAASGPGGPELAMYGRAAPAAPHAPVRVREVPELRARRADSRPTTSPTPVRDRLERPGPHRVVHVELADPHGAVEFVLFRPADLARKDTVFPVITWGNGTDAAPGQYARLLSHLASWGFLVVASTSGNTGTGDEMLRGVQRLKALNRTAGDPLFSHVDTRHIGVAGHSQGAGGAVRAANAPRSPVDVIVTFNLPKILFQNDAETVYYGMIGGPTIDLSVTGLPNQAPWHADELEVPALFASGTHDSVLSGPNSNQKFFAEAQGPAAVGLVEGSGHSDIQGRAEPFLGYVTAWFRRWLARDGLSARAFTGSRPEFVDASGWQYQTVKN